MSKYQSGIIYEPPRILYNFEVDCLSLLLWTRYKATCLPQHLHKLTAQMAHDDQDWLP